MKIATAEWVEDAWARWIKSVEAATCVSKHEMAVAFAKYCIHEIAVQYEQLLKD